MTDTFRLDKRVAIVTGANKGIGQAIAVALARAGANIASVGRTTPDETREAIEAEGQSFAHVNCDLGSRPDAAAIISEISTALAPPDILVNNAGIIRRTPATEFSEQDWDDVMDVNLRAMFFLSQAVARSLLARDTRGKIINIASLLSFQGGITVPSYTASKHGVAGVTRALANEWAGRGINVNAIAPGYIATDNTRALQDDPVRSKEILGRIPAGRWGRPGDIGDAAVFLAAPASDYVNGAILPVDGGWLAR